MGCQPTLIVYIAINRNNIFAWIGFIFQFSNWLLNYSCESLPSTNQIEKSGHFVSNSYSLGTLLTIVALVYLFTWFVWTSFSLFKNQNASVFQPPLVWLLFLLPMLCLFGIRRTFRSNIHRSQTCDRFANSFHYQSRKRQTYASEDVAGQFRQNK